MKIILDAMGGDNAPDEIVKGGVHLVSPECAIPCRVKNENLKAIVNTVKKRTLV